MIGFSTIFQAVLLIAAIAIFSTFIRPTFAELQAIQDETEHYAVALENASVFNQEINRLANIANSFSASELQALQRYLPQSVDPISVMRDIETIVTMNEMELVAIGKAEADGVTTKIPFVPSQGQTVTTAEVESHDFSLTVVGTYEQLKSLLVLLEQNAYPLELKQLTFASAEGGLYTFNLTLQTYALPSTNIE